MMPHITLCHRHLVRNYRLKQKKLVNYTFKTCQLLQNHVCNLSILCKLYMNVREIKNCKISTKQDTLVRHSGKNV